MTLEFFENYIRYDQVLFNLLMGKRIMVNDCKPLGLAILVAMNIERDKFELPEWYGKSRGNKNEN